MKILIAQINPTVGDLKGNVKKILSGIDHGKELLADLVIFPELAISGYPPEDFLLLPHFIYAVEESLEEIVKASEEIAVVVGLPRLSKSEGEKHLHNSAVIIEDGKILGFQDKSLLPTYDVFDERRYFEPGKVHPIWEIKGKKVAITICEDMWQHSEKVKYTKYIKDPIIEIAQEKPHFLVNLSASPYSATKVNERIAVSSKAAQTIKCPVFLCNQVGGNDSLIFDGYSLHIGSEGMLRHHAKGFEEDYLLIDLYKNYPLSTFTPDSTGDLFHALVLGVRDYFYKSGFQKACLGLSGGVDSALVACIGAEALGKENILAINMPSRYSSEEGIEDAEKIVETLEIKSMTLPIDGLFQSHLNLLEKPFIGKSPDETEENIQSRIRGILLMAISNKLGYIVLSTGNKSETAMGYSTLYGDTCGGLAVINDVTKEQVYELCRWINREEEIIPNRILTKAPSAELRPNQKDSDSLPEYEIVDNVLKQYVEKHQSPEEIAKNFHYSLEIVEELIRKIHRNEYKRRQSPPGLRVTEKAFSIGRRFPIVQKWC